MSKFYSKKELFLRIAWGIVEAIAFRYSPRWFYGWRNFILRCFGARIGDGVKIYPSARIMYPWLLEIGDHTLISWDVKIYNLGRTSIGSGVTISQHAHLCGGTHEYLSGHFDLARTGLTVERNVWIATEAFIGPSVTVHEGSLVAARAVVVKDVGSQTIVGGNPARKIGTLEKPYNFAVDGARETKG